MKGFGHTQQSSCPLCASPWGGLRRKRSPNPATDQSSATKGGNLKSLPQPVACPVQDLCPSPGISMDGETPAECTQPLEQCCEWEEKFLPCHQLVPSSRSFHDPHFPLGYRTASVICSCKTFQLQFETQTLLFVSASFLQLQIPVLL